MADLSPAAQAIIDAIGIPPGSSLYPVAAGFSAAALRALAVRIHGADAIRQDVLEIAAELEGTVGD